MVGKKTRGYSNKMVREQNFMGIFKTINVVVDSFMDFLLHNVSHPPTSFAPLYFTRLPVFVCNTAVILSFPLSASPLRDFK